MCVSSSEEIASECDGGDALFWNSADRQFQTASGVWLSSGDFQEQLAAQKDSHGVFSLLKAFNANGGASKFVTADSGSAGIELSLGSDSVVFDMAKNVSVRYSTHTCTHINLSFSLFV